MRKAHLIRTILAVVVVGFLAYYVDPKAMVGAAAGADPRWIAAAVLLLPVNLILEGTVWIYLARRVDPNLSTGDGFGALLAGYSLGFFTPARVGDFAARAFYVRHADKWEIAAVVAVQRLLDMAVGVAAGTVAVIAYIFVVHPEPAALWWTLGGIGCLVGGLLVGAALHPRRARLVADRIVPWEAARRRLDFLKRLSARDGARLLAIASARLAVYLTQFVLLIRALVPAVEAAPTYMGVSVVFLAKFLLPPVTLMDIGIREGASVYVLGGMGYPEAAVLNASLLLFAVNLLLPAAAGIRFVLQMNLTRPNQSSGERPAS